MHTRAGSLPRAAHIILHGHNRRRRTAPGEVGRVARTPLVRSGPVLDSPVDQMILHHLFRCLQRSDYGDEHGRGACAAVGARDMGAATELCANHADVGAAAAGGILQGKCLLEVPWHWLPVIYSYICRNTRFCHRVRQ